MKNIEDELLKNLMAKLDAFIEKGFELSGELDIDEQNKLIKKAINENVDKALDMLMSCNNIQVPENELIERKNKLRQFINNYYDQKIKKGLD